MRPLCLVVLLVGGLTVAHGQVTTYESITIGTTAVGLAAATTDPAGQPQNNTCHGRLETAQVRYRVSSAPTSAEGLLLEVGDLITIDTHAEADAIQFIRTGAVSGVLKVECWRRSTG